MNVFSRIALTLLLVSMLTLTFNIQPVKAEPTTWTVDDDGPADFSKIQDAINAANPGDTIYVNSGTYYENVVVNKNDLTVVGENSSTTVIDGSGTGTVVQVSARNVKVGGFTIQNSGYTLPATGIWITGKNVTIEGNILQYNSDGIYLSSYSTSNTLINNTIVDNRKNRHSCRLDIS